MYVCITKKAECKLYVFIRTSAPDFQHSSHLFKSASAAPSSSLSMRIRANNLHLLPTRPAVICVLNQSPWDVMSSSQLSENLQIIEADDRYFHDWTPPNCSRERKRSPAEPGRNLNQSIGKVAKPRDLRRKRQEADTSCGDDGIYDYYTGFGPSRKKRRGNVVQNCRDAANECHSGRKKDQDDDDEKPLKERSLKELLEGGSTT